MSLSKRLIAAQAALFLATVPLAGAAPQEASAPSQSSGQTKSLTEIFVRAAQPAAADTDNTIPLPDTVNNAAAFESRVQQAWRQALSLGDDDPIGCAVPVTLEKNNRPIIVIDLGHRFESDSGRIDVGTTNRRSGLVEADIVDAVAARVIAMLGAQGFDVIQTRNTREVFQGADGDYKKSLSARGRLPAYLAEETGRPVILLSIHVDNGRTGGAAYVQNDAEGEAHAESYELARAVAATYRLGSEGGRVNPGEDYYAGKGRFNNRMLRTFEAARTTCPAIDGAATLLELGNIRDKTDIASFKKLLKNPEPTAASIMAGLKNFVSRHYPEQTAAPPTLQPAGPQNYLSQ
jgi:N-acetylmuramoyl-L-alanine amidase